MSTRLLFLLLEGALSVAPLLYDPRSRPECALFHSANWSTTLETKTVEDVRIGRTSPRTSARYEGKTQCYGEEEDGDVAMLHLRTVPKVGSTSTPHLMRRWPLARERCCKKGAIVKDGETRRCGSRRLLPPVVFTFARHPYSRLVSAFHTVLRTWWRLHPKEIANVPFVKMLPQRLRRGFNPPLVNGTGKKMVHILDDEHRFPDSLILEVFEQFILDLMVRPPQKETGFNGLEKTLHHAHSQLYFYSMRVYDEALCPRKGPRRRGQSYQTDRDRNSCSPRIDFVGKLEESEAHFGALVDFLASKHPKLFDRTRLEMAANASVLKAAHGVDVTRSGDAYKSSGYRFERVLTPQAISLESTAILKSYYAQDMVCLKDLGYTWDTVETPKWHAKSSG